MTKEEKIFAGVVTVSIEQALLDIGLETLRKVELNMQARYGHDLSESLTHPTHLREVLKELPPDSYDGIVKSIKIHLEDFDFQKTINDFIKILEE
jgi:hypothetical protein